MPVRLDGIPVVNGTYIPLIVKIGEGELIKSHETEILNGTFNCIADEYGDQIQTPDDPVVLSPGSIANIVAKNDDILLFRYSLPNSQQKTLEFVRNPSRQDKSSKGDVVK